MRDQPRVAIVGSGIVGATLGVLLVERGHRVEIFEKGPSYEYPPIRAFEDQAFHLHDGPAWPMLPPDLQGLSQSGSYPAWIDHERPMVAGGAATVWEAITLRLLPSDFKTRTAFGYGADWPISYDDLEPYYCRAETLLGVSGTDDDNPWAPPRSTPYPLPPFELSHDDRWLGERLLKAGVVLHTTPQARTRHDFDNRAACENIGLCTRCPIGARYSPHHHLSRFVESGFGVVHTGVTVRRLVRDDSARVRALVVRQHESNRDEERAADFVVVAGGAIESARLLLLSADAAAPDGLGNSAGHVGQHLAFHHTWFGTLTFEETLYPGRIGAWTAQSLQFCDPPTRGRHGGVKIECTSQPEVFRWQLLRQPLASGEVVVDLLRSQLSTRLIGLMGESTAGPTKHVSLSSHHDRFGDPFAHVHYEANEFDHETHAFAREIFERVANGAGATDRRLADAGTYASGHHHMGTCRMGETAHDSVTDRHLRVHGIPNLLVVGGASFASSGSVNPTLTMVALAARAADFLDEQLR